MNVEKIVNAIEQVIAEKGLVSFYRPLKEGDDARSIYAILKSKGYKLRLGGYHNRMVFVTR